MANTCFNYTQAFGDARALNKLKDYLIQEKEVGITYVNNSIDGELTFTIESRWSPPAEWVCELSERFLGVLLECEYEEQGSDIWGKFGFRDGELLFTMELPYLEGKHKSLGWNEFLECEVMGRLDDCEPFDEFIKGFQFCSEEEVNELKEMYYESQN